MAYWLVKSEPDEWNWSAHVKRKTAVWDGIRNHQANNFMKAMQRGDRAFFYHTGDERQIVGVLEVTRTWQPDPKDETGKFGTVGMTALFPVKRKVTLAEIKATPALRDMKLLKQSRLSVSPLTDAEWQQLASMAETDA
ncbi:MAG: EVE domain-containing protein [Alphaproteobacteria bacterium]